MLGSIFVKTTYFSIDKVQCYFQVLRTQWLCHLIIRVLFKRIVKLRSSKYGWHIYTDVSMMGKFKQLYVVCFDHKICVLANKNLNVNYMYLFSPKGYWAAYSVFLLRQRHF